MHVEPVVVIRNRLTARGIPFHLEGDYAEDCPGSWLHRNYLIDQLEVLRGGLYAEVDFKLALVPEPSNPYDVNAVAVSWNNHHIGYLPAPVAEAYSPHLTDCISRGFVPFIDGQIYKRWGLADEDHPRPKEWVTVHLYVQEDVYREEPIPVWNIPGTKELTAAGAGLLDYESREYFAPASGDELVALRSFMGTFSGDFAIVELVVLPPSHSGVARRVGIQHGGATLGRLSTVSSGRYREQLLRAKAKNTTLAVVIRVSRRHNREGCSVLLPRDLPMRSDGSVHANFEFAVEQQPIPFALKGEVTSLPEVALDFETVHNYYGD